MKVGKITIVLEKVPSDSTCWLLPEYYYFASVEPGHAEIGYTPLQAIKKLLKKEKI
jgi:hypothetical protein